MAHDFGGEGLVAGAFVRTLKKQREERERVQMRQSLEASQHSAMYYKEQAEKILGLLDKAHADYAHLAERYQEIVRIANNLGDSYNDVLGRLKGLWEKGETANRLVIEHMSWLHSDLSHPNEPNNLPLAEARRRNEIILVETMKTMLRLGLYFGHTVDNSVEEQYLADGHSERDWATLPSMKKGHIYGRRATSKVEGWSVFRGDQRYRRTDSTATYTLADAIEEGFAWACRVNGWDPLVAFQPGSATPTRISTQTSGLAHPLNEIIDMVRDTNQNKWPLFFAEPAPSNSNEIGQG